MSDNSIIIAGAGSRKTQHLIEAATAIAEDGERCLIAAYTVENQQQVASRIASDSGFVPELITVSGWLSFLINDGAKPYQRSITGGPFAIRGLNFEGEPRRGTSKTLNSGDFNPNYYLDRQGSMYGRNISDFVCRVNELTDGRVIRRLEYLYDHILIDEAQDLAGWDYDVLELLLAADLDVTLVADPRQRVYSTNRGARRRNLKFLEWVEEHSNDCTLEERTINYRSNQEICDFADSLFPEMSGSTSASTAISDHTGVITIGRSEVHAYHQEHSPQVLRHSRASNTDGLLAMNFGNSKGSEFDHVLIYPTQPIRQFLQHQDADQLADGTRAKLYVAVTRARHSVAFVVD